MGQGHLIRFKNGQLKPIRWLNYVHVILSNFKMNPVFFLPEGIIGEFLTGDGSCLFLKKTIFDIILYILFFVNVGYYRSLKKRDFRSRNQIDNFNLSALNIDFYLPKYTVLDTTHSPVPNLNNEYWTYGSCRYLRIRSSYLKNLKYKFFFGFFSSGNDPFLFFLRLWI